MQLQRSESSLRVLAVPGLGWDCLSGIVQHDYAVLEHLRRQGYDANLIPVDGLGSTPRNAAQIRNYIVELGGPGNRDLVLIGYSKGVPDILESLVRYREVRSRVAAVVSVAGAVGGSPLAEDTTESLLNLLSRVPGANCDESSGDTLTGLRPETRLRWLMDQELPADVSYFSVVAVSDLQHTSRMLRPSYTRLARIDPRNDGQLIARDQIIPGSELLGYLRADHWAVGVHIGRDRPAVISAMVDHNDFPREVLLEAIVRYVEEQLFADSS